MSERMRTTLRLRPLLLAATVAAVAATVVLVYLYWYWIIVAVVCLVGLRIVRPGRRGGFARNVKVLAAAYAAWNTRAIGTGQFKATIRAVPAERKAFELHGETPDYGDGIPF